MSPDALTIFRKICAIPHASGHEAQLVLSLRRMAEDAGLQVAMDSAYNLRIDRPASLGWERAPRIVLQGHTDMVAQKRDSAVFDFDRDLIPLTEEDGFLRSAAGTTLGADDGVGVASAMALLLDKDFRCGPLAALFTTGEETGMNGAAALTPEMLVGDLLFNLDSEDEGLFCAGCAGGCRMRSLYRANWQSPAHQSHGVILKIGGLLGGHSGVNIAEPRGNALLLLSSFAALLPDFSLSSFEGGLQDNTIPHSAEMLGAIPAGALAPIQQKAQIFAAQCRTNLTIADNFFVSVEEAHCPAQAISASDTKELLQTIAKVPNGALSFDSVLKITRTSSNFASARKKDGGFFFCSSQRSLDAAERDELCGKIQRHFAILPMTHTIDSAYPPWVKQENSKLLACAIELYGSMFGKPAASCVIPAGVECGFFQQRAPHLEMISFGPNLYDIHSPDERLDLASFDRFNRFLKALVAACSLGKAR